MNLGTAAAVSQAVQCPLSAINWRSLLLENGPSITLKQTFNDKTEPRVDMTEKGVYSA